ncbi:MAG: dihydropyrimidinase [Deltaproteobacteria bacterium RIFOXYA12_FULL_58_15]|nr:MAG: dihydropyrimidinase [Deltaproteobacteria bacterium RIFOXYA12_FULL_58_15]OGR15001.1 MAG: dihydropyrimidinase [Deltaproteobacteria bacterium RIFOXYB12_FULL_58_9]
MDYDLVIKGGQVASSTGVTRADLAIKGETIAALGSDLTGKQTIDAKGKIVMPGAIDVHNHFQLPFCGTVSSDDFEIGSKAAAMGGVTTFLDFAIQSKPKSVMEAIVDRQAEAAANVCIDYSLHAGITEWNKDRVEEFPKIIEAGIPTFKMFMIYRAQGWQATDADVYRALREAAKYGAMVGLHAESNDLIDLLQEEIKGQKFPGCYAHAVSRPTVTETEAIARAINLAEATGGCLYIFHMSTGRAVDLIRDGRARGVNVHAETGPHYLLLDDELFKREDGHHFGTCPPIRKPADQQGLWKGLAEGVVEVMATDTCTFNSEQKSMWKGDFTKIPFGMPGIETLLPLTYSEGVHAGRFPLERMIEILCENPAKLFGMWPQKGSLKVGTDADVVVFDPDAKVTISHKTLTHRCDYSPFEGTKVNGWPVTTLVRGKPVVKDRKFVGDVGYGKFIKRQPPAKPVA